MEFEQLGVSAVTVALLLWGLKLALAKINKHEEAKGKPSPETVGV